MEKKSNRLLSLDALRGFDMLFISGLAGLIGGLCWLFGAPDCWLARNMEHCAWEGFRHHDTIFPLFLFLAGVSFPFSRASRLAHGATTGEIVLGIVRRAFLLVALGILYNGFLHHVFTGTPRYASVLARIGLAWGFAALLYVFCGVKTRLVAIAAILVGYWALLAFVPSPDAAALFVADKSSLDPYWLRDAVFINGNFSLNGSLAGWVDRLLLPGRLILNGPPFASPEAARAAIAAGAPLAHNGFQLTATGQVLGGMMDPEGILPTIPAVATALLGMLAGDLVRTERFAKGTKAALLAACGAGCGVIAFACAPWCPIVKQLWTSTFALAAASYSFLAFALFYWVADVLGYVRWTFFFKVVGMNSIAIYLLQNIVDMNKVTAWFVGDAACDGRPACGLVALCSAPLAQVIHMAVHLLLCWLVMYFLYRKSVFIKV